MRPHRWQPTRLPNPWDSLGKNTEVGCHFLLQCMKVKSQSEVAQSCPTLSDPTDCSLPGSSIHGIFQARVLEWGAIAFSKLYVTTGYLLDTAIIEQFHHHGKFHRIMLEKHRPISPPEVTQLSGGMQFWLWCWEGLGAGGEGDNQGWDGWMASRTRWTWVWVNSRRWWWTGSPGVLWFMGSQRVGHD